MTDRSQREYWNEAGAGRWTTSHERLNALLEPWADALLERASLADGQRVIDVGCGAGAVSIAASRVCGPGRVTGVDVSTPMLELARRLVAQAGVEVELVEADAGAWRPSAPVDRIVSRWGVMFFEDAPRAFANLRSWLAPDGAFVALAWRAPEDNPWISEPMALVAEYADTPRMVPGGPGPHSLADPDHVRALLAGAGFESVDLEDVEVTVRLDGDVDEVADFWLDWGPSARFFEQADADARPRLVEQLRRLIEGWHDGTGANLVGRCWAIRAAGK
jgi:SAM-dependent methyltransferase